MAHSLEVRVPFLDHEVVELCAAIPTRHKVHRLDTKHVLKHAARGLVPASAIGKRKVGFFQGVADGWFRAQARGAISDYLLGPSPRYAEILDPRGIERLVAKHLEDPGSRHTYGLLSVLMLEIWLSTYLPRATQPAPAREEVVVR
jgi:asparagine synthase (glutamine-hydrolysing)